MKFSHFQIDAFTSVLFAGNPAGVVILKEWPSDSLMRQIARENNFSETAFVLNNNSSSFELRWFTPTTEVELCGHATLAAAKVIFEHYAQQATELTFKTKYAGNLKATKEGEFIALDFPADEIKEVQAPEELTQALGTEQQESFKGRSDYLLVFANQEELQKIRPNFEALRKIETRGVICTACGTEDDFVSRFFAPRVGVNEDPVTGSAHTTLAIYWSKRLLRNELIGRQLSERGGKVKCRVEDDRVYLLGEAVEYLKCEIELPDGVLDLIRP